MDEFAARARTSVAAASESQGWSAKAAVQYIDMLDAAGRKDAAAILPAYTQAKGSQKSGYPDWRFDVAWRLLQDMPKETRAAAAKAIASDDVTFREWAMLLADQKSDDAVDLVRSWVRRHRRQPGAVTVIDLEPLGVLGTDRAYGLLRELAADPDPFVQGAAKGVLSTHPPAPAAPAAE